MNTAQSLPWDLWSRQIASVLRLEVKKSFLSRRALWIYLLACAPVLLTGGHTLHQMALSQSDCSVSVDTLVFAGIFQFFYLRLGIYFGCVGIFTNLFREEMLERTMHYYLLTPMRREVLLAGKYLAGLLASGILFSLSVAASYLLIAAHLGDEWREFLFAGQGMYQLAWYLVVTILACVGYGAVFVLAGLIFRNPMIPAAVIMVWEAANAFLPPILQRLSVTFYLKSLSPVEIPVKGPLALFAVNATPTPAWLAIPGLILVSLAILSWGSRRVRNLEISYTE